MPFFSPDQLAQAMKFVSKYGKNALPAIEENASKIEKAILPEAEELTAKLGSGKNLEALQEAKYGAPQQALSHPGSDAVIQDALAERQGFNTVGDSFTSEGVPRGNPFNPEVSELPNPKYKSELPNIPEVPAIRQNTLPQALENTMPSIEQGVSNDLPMIRPNTIDTPSTDIMKLSEEAIPSLPKSNLARNLGIGALGAGAIGTGVLLNSEDNGLPKQPIMPVSRETTELESHEEVPQPSKSITKNTVTSASQSQKTPITNSQTIPNPTDEFDKKMVDARDQDRERLLNMSLLRAAQGIGGALAGNTNDTKFADAEIADKNRESTRLKTDMDVKEEHQNILDKNKLRDPNSDISRQARNMLAEVYPDLVKKYPNISAYDLDKMGMNLGALTTTKENIAARKETARMHNETMAISRSNKMDELEAKHLEEYRKARDPMLASARSGLGKNYAKYMGIESALELIKGIKDIGEITPMQKRELGVALATAVSPGLPHQDTVNKITSDSGVNDWFAQKFQDATGYSYGTHTPGLTSQLITSLKNQKKQATSHILSYQNSVDSSYAPHITKHPNAFQDVAKLTNYNAGIEQDGNNSTTINNSGLVTIKSKKSGAQKTLKAEDAAKYLNSPDFERVQ
jgi:hypothetical protein